MDLHAPLRTLGETAYPVTAASARVRLANFVPFLKGQGVELDYRPTLSDTEYQRLSSKVAAPRKAAVLATSGLRAALPRPAHDLLMVHRLRLMSPVPGLDPPRRLDVYDLDDALFLGSAAEVNRRFQWVKQEAARCIKCLRRSRLVIAGNSYLASRSSEYASWVEVVPSCVDPDVQPQREHAEREVVTIGWIGSHTTSAYLEPLLRVVGELNRTGPWARLVLVGADPGLQADWIEHRQWSLKSEKRDLCSFDIGVMPLPDTEWARGKCGYKLLQYFAAGVPVVASPVGVNNALVGDGRGYLASDPDEWRSALEQLIEHADERQERGAAARSFVEREYSYQRWAPELADLLQSVVDSS